MFQELFSSCSIAQQALPMPHLKGFPTYENMAGHYFKKDGGEVTQVSKGKGPLIVSCAGNPN